MTTAWIQPLPTIAAQIPTDLANRRPEGQRGHPFSQRRRRLSCITAAIPPQSRQTLLAHSSMSAAHMSCRDWSICLNLHMHILSAVWSYGAPDSPSHRHTSHQTEPAEFVIQAVPSIHPSISASQSSEGSHIQRQSWTRTHTYTTKC